MRLKQVTIWGGVTTYQYNGDGDRISESVDGVTTTYVIDTATPLTMVLAESTNGNTIRYWHALDLVAQSDGVQTESMVYDGLGSVRQVSDSAGTSELAQTFDLYGNTYSRSGIQSTNFGYTGEYQDQNGLLYLRARYYAVSMGRFVNTDPSRQEQNPYSYGSGNPILNTDLSGLCGSPSAGWSAPQQDSPAQKPYCTQQTTKQDLVFEPVGDFQPVKLFTGEGANVFYTGKYNIPASQFNLPGYKDNFTLCGPFAVTAVIQNLLGSSAPGLYKVLDTLFDKDDTGPDQGIVPSTQRGTSWGDLYNLVEEIPGVSVDKSLTNEGDHSEYLNYDADYFYNPINDYFGNEVRPNLTGIKWPIAYVGLAGIGGTCYSPDTCKLSTPPTVSGELAHFVVITGLSDSALWAQDRDIPQGANTDYRWIRVFNPFTNGSQYYRANTFYSYQGFHHGLLWITKDSQ